MNNEKLDKNIENIEEVDELLNDDEPRQNFVTSVPLADDEEVASASKKSLLPIFVALGVIVLAGAIALFFIFRGKPQETALIKDNSSKVGVNANVNNANSIDFQTDYQKRYGADANTNPIVSNSNAEISNPQYGNVGNITAPPPLYNGQIYQPSVNNSNSNPSSENGTKVNLGSSTSSGETTAKNKAETTRVKANSNSEIVEFPKNNAEYRNISAARNEQGSLYFYDSVLAKTNKSESNPNYSKIEIASNVLAKPTFGTVLPVRILGSLHTLGTNGLARLELTRPVEGSWGYLPSGTLFVGRIQGGEADRLFVSLIGYLTDDNRLVPIGGDLQGLDGALGLKGQSKKLGSRWSKIFGELLSTAKDVGSSYLLGRKGGSGTVVNTGQLEGIPDSLMNSNATRYVVIPAGSSGYVVINELPPAVTSNNRVNQNKQISDEELLKLIQTNSNKELENIMPELSSEGRTIAKRVLEN